VKTFVQKKTTACSEQTMSVFVQIERVVDVMVKLCTAICNFALQMFRSKKETQYLPKTKNKKIKTKIMK
jgi:hypothetical protein